MCCSLVGWDGAGGGGYCPVEAPGLNPGGGGPGVYGGGTSLDILLQFLKILYMSFEKFFLKEHLQSLYVFFGLIYGPSSIFCKNFWI